MNYNNILKIKFQNPYTGKIHTIGSKTGLRIISQYISRRQFGGSKSSASSSNTASTLVVEIYEESDIGSIVLKRGDNKIYQVRYINTSTGEIDIQPVPLLEGRVTIHPFFLETQGMTMEQYYDFIYLPNVRNLKTLPHKIAFTKELLFGDSHQDRPPLEPRLARSIETVRQAAEFGQTCACDDPNCVTNKFENIIGLLWEQEFLPMLSFPEQEASEEDLMKVALQMSQGINPLLPCKDKINFFTSSDIDIEDDPSDWVIIYAENGVHYDCFRKKDIYTMLYKDRFSSTYYETDKQYSKHVLQPGFLQTSIYYKLPPNNLIIDQASLLKILSSGAPTIVRLQGTRQLNGLVSRGLAMKLRNGGATADTASSLHGTPNTRRQLFIVEYYEPDESSTVSKSLSVDFEFPEFEFPGFNVYFEQHKPDDLPFGGNIMAAGTDRDAIRAIMGAKNEFRKAHREAERQARSEYEEAKRQAQEEFAQQPNSSKATKAHNVDTDASTSDEPDELDDIDDL